MWAGTVVAPPGLTSAVTVSMTSRSRSVAFNDSSVTLERSSTLARIGIVLRRSTTRCTWDSDLSRSARSTVTFMRNPAYPCRVTRGAEAVHRRRRDINIAKHIITRKFPGFWTVSIPGYGNQRRLSLLQLALQHLDFGGEAIVRSDQ